MIKAFVTCAHCGGQRDTERERCSGCGSSKIDGEAEAHASEPYRHLLTTVHEVAGDVCSSEAIAHARKVNDYEQWPGVRLARGTCTPVLKPKPGFAGLFSKEDTAWSVTLVYEIST